MGLPVVCRADFIVNTCIFILPWIFAFCSTASGSFYLLSLSDDRTGSQERKEGRQDTGIFPVPTIYQELSSKHSHLLLTSSLQPRRKSRLRMGWPHPSAQQSQQSFEFKTVCFQRPRSLWYHTNYSANLSWGHHAHHRHSINVCRSR